MLVEVSVPFVAALIADDGKYYMQPKRLEDDTDAATATAGRHCARRFGRR
jgi:hypothetical protein